MYKRHLKIRSESNGGLFGQTFLDNAFQIRKRSSADEQDILRIHRRKPVSYTHLESVAQHTFAMLLFLLEKLRYYDDYVKEGRYTNDTIFTHFEERFYELHGKTFGIIGLGNIGRRVASIAEAFGLNVIYASPSGSAPQDGYHQVDLDTLLDVYKRQI